MKKVISMGLIFALMFELIPASYKEEFAKERLVFALDEVKQIANQDEHLIGLMQENLQGTKKIVAKKLQKSPENKFAVSYESTKCKLKDLLSLFARNLKSLYQLNKKYIIAASSLIGASLSLYLGKRFFGEQIYDMWQKYFHKKISTIEGKTLPLEKSNDQEEQELLRKQSGTKTDEGKKIESETTNITTSENETFVEVSNVESSAESEQKSEATETKKTSSDIANTEKDEGQSEKDNVSESSGSEESGAPKESDPKKPLTKENEVFSTFENSTTQTVIESKTSNITSLKKETPLESNSTLTTMNNSIEVEKNVTLDGSSNTTVISSNVKNFPPTEETKVSKGKVLRSSIGDGYSLSDNFYKQADENNESSNLTISSTEFLDETYSLSDEFVPKKNWRSTLEKAFNILGNGVGLVEDNLPSIGLAAGGIITVTGALYAIYRKNKKKDDRQQEPSILRKISSWFSSLFGNSDKGQGGGGGGQAPGGVQGNAAAQGGDGTNQAFGEGPVFDGALDGGGASQVPSGVQGNAAAQGGGGVGQAPGGVPGFDGGLGGDGHPEFSEEDGVACLIPVSRSMPTFFVCPLKQKKNESSESVENKGKIDEKEDGSLDENSESAAPKKPEMRPLVINRRHSSADQDDGREFISTYFQIRNMLEKYGFERYIKLIDYEGLMQKQGQQEKANLYAEIYSFCTVLSSYDDDDIDLLKSYFECALQKIYKELSFWRRVVLKRALKEVQEKMESKSEDPVDSSQDVQQVDGINDGSSTQHGQDSTAITDFSANSTTTYKSEEPEIAPKPEEEDQKKEETSTDEDNEMPPPPAETKVGEETPTENASPSGNESVNLQNEDLFNKIYMCRFEKEFKGKREQLVESFRQSTIAQFLEKIPENNEEDKKRYWVEHHKKRDCLEECIAAYKEKMKTIKQILRFDLSEEEVNDLVSEFIENKAKLEIAETVLSELDKKADALRKFFLDEHAKAVQKNKENSKLEERTPNESENTPSSGSGNSQNHEEGNAIGQAQIAPPSAETKVGEETPTENTLSSENEVYSHNIGLFNKFYKSEYEKNSEMVDKQAYEYFEKKNLTRFSKGSSTDEREKGRFFLNYHDFSKDIDTVEGDIAAIEEKMREIKLKLNDKVLSEKEAKKLALDLIKNEAKLKYAKEKMLPSLKALYAEAFKFYYCAASGFVRSRHVDSIRPGFKLTVKDDGTVEVKEVEQKDQENTKGEEETSPKAEGEDPVGSSQGMEPASITSTPEGEQKEEETSTDEDNEMPPPPAESKDGEETSTENTLSSGNEVPLYNPGMLNIIYMNQYSKNYLREYKRCCAEYEKSNLKRFLSKIPKMEVGSEVWEDYWLNHSRAEDFVERDIAAIKEIIENIEQELKGEILLGKVEHLVFELIRNEAKLAAAENMLSILKDHHGEKLKFFNNYFSDDQVPNFDGEPDSDLNDRNLEVMILGNKVVEVKEAERKDQENPEGEEGTPSENAPSSDNESGNSQNHEEGNASGQAQIAPPPEENPKGEEETSPENAPSSDNESGNSQNQEEVNASGQASIVSPPVETDDKGSESGEGSAEEPEKEVLTNTAEEAHPESSEDYIQISVGNGQSIPIPSNALQEGLAGWQQSQNANEFLRRNGLHIDIQQSQNDSAQEEQASNEGSGQEASTEDSGRSGQSNVISRDMRIAAARSFINGTTQGSRIQFSQFLNNSGSEILDADGGTFLRSISNSYAQPNQDSQQVIENDTGENSKNLPIANAFAFAEKVHGKKSKKSDGKIDVENIPSPVKEEVTKRLIRDFNKKTK